MRKDCETWMCIVTEIDLTQGHKNISSILEILQINCDLSKNNKMLQKKGGRSFLESVQMTKHETITWRRWWSCSPWTSWPPSPQRRPGLEQAEMKIYWGLKSFWPNRCLLLGKPSCKKKCFLSGIARITSPPQKIWATCTTFFGRQKRRFSAYYRTK